MWLFLRLTDMHATSSKQTSKRLRVADDHFYVFTKLAQRKMTPLPKLRLQENSFDDPRSNYMFRPSEHKPFMATPAAVEMYGAETIRGCLTVLRLAAIEHHGLDYVQVFESHERAENLWIIEDGPSGAITALLPSDY